MADFFTAYMLGAATGGATSKIVEMTVENGARWLRDYWRGHGEQIQMEAQDNTMEFLSRLSNRVDDLEQDQANVQKRLKRLSDPDFAASLKSTLIAAARTKSRTRHEVLSDLIVKRLTSDAESTDAVISATAIEVMPRLSRDHLVLLSVVPVLQWPTHWTWYADAHEEENRRRYEQHLNTSFDREEYTGLRVGRWDANYLSAIGCLQAGGGVVEWAFERLLQRPKYADGWSPEEWARRSPQGRMIRDLWESTFRRGYPTLLGLTIGEAVKAALFSPPEEPSEERADREDDRQP